MDLQLQFSLERYKRDIDNCQSLDELKTLAVSLLELYYRQQELMKTILKESLNGTQKDNPSFPPDLPTA